MFCFGECSSQFAQCVAQGGSTEVACCTEPEVPATCGDHCPGECEEASGPSVGCGGDGGSGGSGFGGAGGMGVGGVGGVTYDPCTGVLCGFGEVCSNGFCVSAGCTSDWDCPLGEVCWGSGVGTGVCQPDGQVEVCVADGACSAGETCACEAFCCSGGGSSGGGTGPGGSCGWNGGPTISYGDCAACGGSVVWSVDAFVCEGMSNQ